MGLVDAIRVAVCLLLTRKRWGEIMRNVAVEIERERAKQARGDDERHKKFLKAYSGFHEAVRKGRGY